MPGADLRVGDMQALPYDDGRFDLVAGFNSFFYAADANSALEEAWRVARYPARCDLSAMKEATAAFLAAPSGGAAQPAPLWEPGVLERIAAEAGLNPKCAFDVSWAYRYPDEEALARGLVAPGGLAARVGPEREPALRRAVVDSLARHRLPDGSYRLRNEWRCLIASA